MEGFLFAMMVREQENKFELCCFNMKSVVAAQRGGANAIELCSNHAEGGVTPSLGMVDEALEVLTIPVYVMVRPRGGNFVYGNEGLRVMIRDIEYLKKKNVAGIVSGALTTAGDIDMNTTKELIRACEGTYFRFHRAIDIVNNYAVGVAQLIDLGVNSLLTSGSATNAWKGRNSILTVINQYNTKLDVVAAGGIKHNNIRNFIEVGIHHVHGSLAQYFSPSQSSLIDFNVPLSSNCMDIYSAGIDDVKKMMMLLNQGN